MPLEPQLPGLGEKAVKACALGAAATAMQSGAKVYKFAAARPCMHMHVQLSCLMNANIIKPRDVAARPNRQLTSKQASYWEPVPLYSLFTKQEHFLLVRSSQPNNQHKGASEH
jgi:hypothetical protein